MTRCLMLFLVLFTRCGVESSTLKDGESSLTQGQTIEVHPANLAAIVRDRQEIALPQDKAGARAVRAVLMGEIWDRSDVFEQIPEVADNCEWCSLGHFERLEQPTGGELTSCGDVRRDFFTAQRLWRQLEEKRIVVTTKIRDLEDPARPEQLSEVQQLLNEMIEIVGEISQLYPKNYNHKDRVTKLRYKLSRYLSGSTMEERYKLSSARATRFAMPGGLWKTGDRWHVDDLKRVVTPPVKNGNYLELEIEESPMQACLGSSPIALRLATRHVIATLLNPPLPGPIPRPGVLNPALPARPIVSPIPRPDPFPSFLLQDEDPILPPSTPQLFIDQTIIVVTRSPEHIVLNWAPLGRCQPNPCQTPLGQQ